MISGRRFEDGSAVCGRSRVPVTSLETFSWLDGGSFLVQTYETVFGDEPAQKGVNYWMYDSERKGFGIVFFSNNGPYSDAGNRYYGEVADDRLAMVGPARFQYELDQEGRSNEPRRLGLRRVVAT